MMTQRVILNYAYKIHDELTDKKLLGTITEEEEKLLEDIRNYIEYRNEDKYIIASYQYKIDRYKELSGQIKELKRMIR